MEAMCRAVHCWAKASAVKAPCSAPSLHAFDDKNIFLEDCLPLCRVICTKVGVAVFYCIVEMNMFNGFGVADGFQNNGKGMIAMNSKEHVGIDGDIFRRGIPLVRKIFEIWKNLVVFTL